MKKASVILTIMIAILSGTFAGDLDMAFEDARFHGDFLGGFAPFYLRAGIDYKGFELINDQRTDFYIVGGGALIKSKIWTDEDGIPLEQNSEYSSDKDFMDRNAYSKWQGDFSLKLKQGLIHEPGREKAFFAVYGKYAFHWTDPHENWYDGANLSSFLSGTSSAYPDNEGTVSHLLQAGFEVDRLDKGDVFSGFNIDGSVKYAPGWLFNESLGKTDFQAINLTAKGYYPLLDLNRSGSDLELIGIYLADRVMVDYLTGEAIPQFFQEAPALGTKIRGFENNSLGTEFSIVNNLEVRFYGIEFTDNINPVLTLFMDAGYHSGKYYNTNYSRSGFICSTGFETMLNIVDFAQAGMIFGFPLAGSNMQEQTMQTKIIFRYHF